MTFDMKFSKQSEWFVYIHYFTLIFIPVYLTISNRASSSEIFEWSDLIGQFEIRWSGPSGFDLLLNTVSLRDDTESVVLQSGSLVGSDTGQVVYIMDHIDNVESDYTNR